MSATTATEGQPGGVNRRRTNHNAATAAREATSANRKPAPGPPGAAEAAPEGAAAISRGDSVALNWESSTTGAAGYNVYRSTSPLGKFARLNSSPIAAALFSDKSVSDGTTYYYRIMAVDPSGGQSSPVNAIARA